MIELRSSYTYRVSHNFHDFSSICDTLAKKCFQQKLISFRLATQSDKQYFKKQKNFINNCQGHLYFFKFYIFDLIVWPTTSWSPDDPEGKEMKVSTENDNQHEWMTITCVYYCLFIFLNLTCQTCLNFLSTQLETLMQGLPNDIRQRRWPWELPKEKKKKNFLECYFCCSV